jgi:hypothetical protein
MRHTAVLAFLVLPATGWAKPTSAEAAKAAHAWLIALKSDPVSPSLEALTAVPFAWATDFMDEAACPAEIAPTPDKLGAAFDCLRGIIQDRIAKVRLKGYKKGYLSGSSADHAKGVLSVEDATLVHAWAPCIGTEEDVVLAVVKDGKTAKVAGVYALNEICGE